jgi:hypothetical protein
LRIISSGFATIINEQQAHPNLKLPHSERAGQQCPWMRGVPACPAAVLVASVRFRELEKIHEKPR